MSEPLPDIVRWLFCIVGLGLLAGAGGYLFVTLRRRSFNQAWAPLASIIDGTVTSEGTRSVMKGVYLGHPVRTTLTAGEAGTPGTFSIELQSETHGPDWALVFGRAQLFGTSNWHVETEDPTLENELIEAGALAEIQGWPEDVTIRYDGRAGTLVYREDHSALTPERLREELDLLVRLEGLMHKVM